MLEAAKDRLKRLFAKVRAEEEAPALPTDQAQLEAARTVVPATAPRMRRPKHRLLSRWGRMFSVKGSNLMRYSDRTYEMRDDGWRRLPDAEHVALGGEMERLGWQRRQKRAMSAGE